MKVILFVALPSEFPKELVPNGVDIHYTGVGKINAAIKATEVLNGLDPNETIVINYGSAGSNLEKNHIYKCVKFLQGDINAEPIAQNGVTPFDEIIYPNLQTEITFEGNGHVCCTQDQFEKNPNDNMIYDMEAYSIAKICKVNGFYFASFKYISDSGDSDDWQKNHDKGSHAFGQLLNTLIVSLLDKNGPDGGTVDTSVLGTDAEGCESSNLSWGTKKPKIHFLTFATGTHRDSGYRFEETQKKLVESIQLNTQYEVILHTHNLNTMVNQDWFYKIKDYPKMFTNEWWKRDGYCAAWKVFFVKQLMNIVDDGDIIYYTDSSAYYKEGFTENIDRLIKYVVHNGHACGAMAIDCKHNDFGCCDNVDVWNTVYHPVKLDFSYMLNKYHILSSWFCFKKDKTNTDFVNEWVHWITYKLNDIPLCKYHHTIEQSIFNMLIYKYGFKVFFCEENTHEENKNHNLVHYRLNTEPNDDVKNLEKWFYNPHDI